MSLSKGSHHPKYQFTNKLIKKEKLEMMFKEEGQILDLELETKKEQFKMTKKTHTKLF